MVQARDHCSEQYCYHWSWDPTCHRSLLTPGSLWDGVSGLDRPFLMVHSLGQAAEHRCVCPRHCAGVRSCCSDTLDTTGRSGVGAAVKSAGFLMGTGVSGTRRGWSGTHGPLHAPRAGSKGDSAGRTRVGWGWRSLRCASPGNCSKGWVGLRSISAA